MKLTRDKVIEKIEKGESLAGLDLSGLDLSNIDFGYAKEEHFNLYDTDLSEANLQNTRGLREQHLAGSDLTNCQLPYELTTTDFKLKIAEESSKNARKIFFTVLIGALYCALTIAATRDVDLFTEALSSKLPIVQSNINIVWFYIFAPLLLVGGYFYFHLYLLRLWENLASLPAVFPDGSRLDQKTYPWLLNGMIVRHLKQLRKKRPALSLWQYLASLILGWMVVPFTLYLFWARYLGRHHLFVTGLHLFSLASAVTIGVTFFLHLKNGFQKSHHNNSRYKKIKWKNRVILTSTFLLCSLLFSFLSSKAFWGLPYDFHLELKSFPKKGLGVKLPDELLKKGIIKSLDDRPDQVYFVTNDENTLKSDLSHKAFDFYPELKSFSKSDLDEKLPEELLEKGVIKALAGNPDKVYFIANDEPTLKKQLSEFEFEKVKEDNIIRKFNKSQSRIKDKIIEKFNTSQSRLKGLEVTDFNVFISRILKHISHPFADLFHANLSKKPPAWQAQKENPLLGLTGVHLEGEKKGDLKFSSHTDLSQVKGIERDNTNLRFANLSGSFLAKASLKDADLSYADLKEADLRGASLQRATLANATLRRATLENTDLYDATLENAKLSEANLENANLKYANLEKASLFRANLENATLWNANLEKASLMYANLKNADLRGANLENADLEGANLENAELIDASFKKAYLKKSTLTKANLMRAAFENANLWNATLENANLWNATLENANLKYANLENAFLRGANLKYATLWNANLENAELQEAILENAYLREANLENANLGEANLENADLGFATLENANLWKATLENTNLEYANLENADLEGANLEYAYTFNANFKGATLKNTNFKNAVLWGTDFRYLNKKFGISQEQLNSAAKQGCFRIKSFVFIKDNKMIAQELIKEKVIMNKDEQLYCFQGQFNDKYSGRERLEKILDKDKFKTAKYILLLRWDLSHKPRLLPRYLNKNNHNKNEKVDTKSPVADKTPQNKKKK